MIKGKTPKNDTYKEIEQTVAVTVKLNPHLAGVFHEAALLKKTTLQGAVQTFLTDCEYVQDWQGSGFETPYAMN